MFWVGTTTECAALILKDPDCAPYAFINQSLDQVNQAKPQKRSPQFTRANGGFVCRCWSKKLPLAPACPEKPPVPTNPPNGLTVTTATKTGTTLLYNVAAPTFA